MNPDRDPDERNQRAVQSVEIGGRLLLALGARAAAMTLKDLAAAAGLSPSRAHPYLVSFARLGLIEQDRATGRYALGPAAFQIGISCLHQSDSIQAASQVAEALVRETGQSAAISVWANFGPTVVRVLEGRRPLHANMRAGTVMELFLTATGRAFAAVLPGARVAALWAEPHHAQRINASLSGASLEQLLMAARAEVGKHGLARAVGKPLPGIHAFAAAARDHEGQPTLVLTLLGPADTFPIEWNGALAERMRSAVAEISTRLGYRPNATAVGAAPTASSRATSIRAASS